MRDRCGRWLDAIASWASSPSALIEATALVVVWLALGKPMDFSDTWQLLINTPTTVITFLLLFIVSYAAGRRERAMHVKLDEILRAIEDADSSLVGLEQASEAEIKERQARSDGETDLPHS